MSSLFTFIWGAVDLDVFFSFLQEPFHYENITEIVFVQFVCGDVGIYP